MIMSEKMKAIVKVKAEKNGTELMDVNMPKPDSHGVLIKIDVASICGTDVHIFNWDQWAESRIKVPLLYGHEFAGHAVEDGETVSSVGVGDYVSGECHIYCGQCIQCRTGLSHICQNMKVFGVDSDGIFAEYASIPESNVWKNNPEISPELCSIQDPLGNAVHSVFSTDVVGKDVVILGLGPIGLMTAAICEHTGSAQVFAVERFNSYRTDLAKKIGVDAVFQSTEDAEEAIKTATKGKGADVVFEMSGSLDAMQAGLKLLKAGGTMILLGVYSKPALIDLSNDIVFKYITLKGIFGRRIFDDWYKMRGLLGTPSIQKKLQTIITHRYPFEQFFDGMEAMRSGKSGKVVLTL